MNVNPCSYVRRLSTGFSFTHSCGISGVFTLPTQTKRKVRSEATKVSESDARTCAQERKCPHQGDAVRIPPSAVGARYHKRGVKLVESSTRLGRDCWW